MNTITVKSIEKRTFTPIERTEIGEKYQFGVGVDLIKSEIILYGAAFDLMLANSTGDCLVIEWGVDQDMDEFALIIFYRRYDAYILTINDHPDSESLVDYIKIFFKFDFTKDADHIMDQLMFRSI